MALADLFLLTRARQRIRRLANQLAHNSHRSAWQRVSGQITGMNRQEARGYLRARVAATLSRELRAMGYRKLSARPRHDAQAEGAIEEFKKTSPRAGKRPHARRASTATR